MVLKVFQAVTCFFMVWDASIQAGDIHGCILKNPERSRSGPQTARVKGGVGPAGRGARGARDSVPVCSLPLSFLMGNWLVEDNSLLPL